MSRIKTVFDKLKSENKKALITFVTAGDPSIEATEQIIYAKAEAGADIIELGIPFSDPPADGPVIQAASKRALDNGVKIKHIFEMVKRVRKNIDTPLVYMVYFNMIYAYGVANFIDECIKSGIDGIIVPDLPLEERHEIAVHMPEELDLIPLVAPNSGNRIPAIVEDGAGFVYCVSSMGVTGTRDSIQTDVKAYIETVRKATDLPLALGFGISNRADVEKFEEFADGIIVGSAIVKIVANSNGDANAVAEKVRELKGN